MNARKMLLVGTFMAMVLTASGVAVAGPWPPKPYPIKWPHYYPPVITPVVVVRPPVFVRPVVRVNPPACALASVRIMNPVTTGVTLSYTLNGQPFRLAAGSMEEVGQMSVIEFDRGNGQGMARFTLDGGTYTFTPGSDGGWDLFRTAQ